MLARKRVVVQRLLNPGQHQRRGIRQLHLFRRLGPLSAVPLRDLPARESLSTSPQLPSPCLWAPLSTRCDKNAPGTAATAPPDKIQRGFPPDPGTCPRRTAAHPSARALSNAAETMSSWPCLPSFRTSPPQLRFSRNPSRNTTGGCLRSAGCARSRSARRSLWFSFLPRGIFEREQLAHVRAFMSHPLKPQLDSSSGLG